MKQMFLCFCTLAIGLNATGESVSFSRDIRPILFGKCVECHGIDKQKGGVRLDAHEFSVQPGESDLKPILPGDPSKSEILYRVTVDDPDERMPPKGPPLTEAEVASLRQWVADGAVYEKHWADVPVSKPPLPELPVAAGASLLPIDRFVQARQIKMGLHPAPEASRYTLARRAALDLTGLPPSVEELQAFVQDASPKAWENYLDRLLASPHFGEKWARWWLDLARYADTNGYESDEPRTMWAYRDWVIQALNDNLSFDQFTLWQLAGDLLEKPTLDQRIATGFHRNSLINTEGGSKEDEFKDAAIKDRVTTTFTVWMASTMECAMCHSHKYDPISQSEFYQLYAFFNNTTDKATGGESNTVQVPLSENPEVDRLREDIARLEAGVKDETKERKRNPAVGWTVIHPSELVSDGGATFTRLEDDSILAGGTNPDRDIYTIRFQSPNPISAIRLEALPDPSLPQMSLGRFQNGNFVLTDVELERETVEMPFASVWASYSQSGYDIANAIDANKASGWAVDGNHEDKRVPRTAFFALEESGAAGNYTLTLKFESRFSQHSIGRFRISASAQPPPELQSAPSALAESLSQARKKLAALEKENSTTVMVMIEGKPQKTHRQDRGNFLELKEEVFPGTPASFGNPLGHNPPNRLDLAKWLIEPRNPRTSRVTVNRIWDELFGRAFVTTSEDFGVQGNLPSHPELLDWLAADFMETGWDLKHFLKSIMLSSTYRQDSRVSAELLEQDPYNVFLSRGPRFRAPAEMIRDIGLKASGLLNPQVGGKPVYPPQPATIWENLFVEGGLKVWPESQDGQRYRRGLYTYIKRTALHPMMRNFDAPARSVCTVRRGRSNTPLAALNTLNDPAFVEFAGGLAREMLLLDGGDTERLENGFLRCTSMPLPPEGRVELVQLLKDAREHYEQDPAAADQLVDDAYFSPPEPLLARFSPREIAAWVMVGNVLLNLDATLVKP